MKSTDKILLLADNTSNDSWGHKLSKNFAKNHNIIFRGALITPNQKLQNGCYHTGPFSLQQKDIIDASKKFDQIILLDQPQEQFSHSRIFLAMWKLTKDLTNKGIKVRITNPDNMQYLNDWEKYFENNKSFCVNPWVLMHDGQDGYTSLCGRNWDKIKKRDKIQNWKDDPEYNNIRNKMLNGQKISGCHGCYRFEEKGIRDMRWTDSFDWITRFKIKNVNDLEKFTSPVYFEIRPSNKCNLKCRMCSPKWSHLIEKECNEIQDTNFLDLIIKDQDIVNTPSFNQIDLDKIERLYIAGGEPTIMPEVYKFLRECVLKNKTTFELNINTNAVKISESLFELFKKFSKLWFTCSIDGLPKVTEYIRWGTDSKKQIQNIHRLKKNGAGIHFICVISIYNVHQIGEIMEFFDREFPYATIQLNHADFKYDILSAWNHPHHDLVIQSLEKAMNTKCYYHQERGSKPIVDDLYESYLKKPSLNIEKLTKFFYYNDTLDKHRGSRLSDYIPELEECRKYIR